MQDLTGWTRQYVRWLEVIRKLEDAYDKTLSAPLREAEFKVIVEAAYGHALEIRAALVSSDSVGSLLSSYPFPIVL